MGALLVLWILAGAVRSSLAAMELFCNCHADRRSDRSLAVHCHKGQDNNTELNCTRAAVVEVLPGYQYVPGYALVKLFRTFRTWEEAEKKCEANGGHLAVPTDRSAVNGLKQLFISEPGIWYAYLGINDRKTEGKFVGADGEPAPFMVWQKNEPNNANGNEDCVYMRNDGMMNDYPCNLENPFFCERRLSVVVPDTYRWLGEAGRFYKVHTDQQTYLQAAFTCHSENATLAVPDTWRRAEAILRLLTPATQQYFIGLTDEVVEGDFVTETGRHIRDMEFQEWNTNEPNNDYWGKPENCMVLTGNGYLNDYNCEMTLPFVCEILPA